MADYTREEIDEIVAQTRPVHYKVRAVDSDGNEIDPNAPKPEPQMVKVRAVDSDGNEIDPNAPKPEPQMVKVKVVDPQKERREQAEELLRMFGEWMVENGHENDGQGFDSPLFEQWVNQLDD
jgi:hypothetical protein